MKTKMILICFVFLLVLVVMFLARSPPSFNLHKTPSIKNTGFEEEIKYWKFNSVEGVKGEITGEWFTEGKNSYKIAVEKIPEKQSVKEPIASLSQNIDLKDVKEISFDIMVDATGLVTAICIDEKEIKSIPSFQSGIILSGNSIDVSDYTGTHNLKISLTSFSNNPGEIYLDNFRLVR